MTEAHVSPLAESEITALVQLAQRIWRAHYPAIISLAQIEYMLAQRYQPEIIAGQMANSNERWLVAAGDGGLIGFAHVCRIEPHIAKLDKLYVAPEHQRRGVGRALLEAIEVWARARGCRRLSLRVNKANRQALAAYAAYGFVMKAEMVEDIGGGFIMDDYQLEKAL